jgi:hypothetical protein
VLYARCTRVAATMQSIYSPSVRIKRSQCNLQRGAEMSLGVGDERCELTAVWASARRIRLLTAHATTSPSSSELIYATVLPAVLQFAAIIKGATSKANTAVLQQLLRHIILARVLHNTHPILRCPQRTGRFSI